MTRWIFLLWTIAGSIWDIRMRKVPMGWLILGMSAAVFFFCMRYIPLIYNDELTVRAVLVTAGAALIPGSFLFAVSFFSKGAIGRADGWYLLVLGLLRGFAESCGCLLGGIFLAGIAAGAGLLLRRLNRESRLPLLPFFTVAWLLIQLCEITI